MDILQLRAGDLVRFAAAIPPWANVGDADGDFEIGAINSTIAAGSYVAVGDIVTALAAAAGAPYDVSYSSVTNRVTISNGGGANFSVVVASGDLLAAHLGFTVSTLSGANSYTSAGPPRVWPYGAVVQCPELAGLLEQPDDGRGSSHAPNVSLWPASSVLDVPLPSGGSAYTYYGWAEGEGMWRRVTAPARLHSLSFSVADSDGTALSFDDPILLEIRVKRSA